MAGLDVGADIAGHRLEAVIGRGGMGVVYRARDLALDRVVALKVIAPEFAAEEDFRERFKRESQQAASIRHPNVISIYRAGEEGDLLFITMDYVEGTDLKTFIGVRGRLDPLVAAGLISQVAGGLEAAHARGLVHRDVKPANVLIENQQHAYLTDFGLTKRAAPGSALTRTGLIVGTTDYLAPEQIQGDKLDARVDVYALGCVLYEALTGFVPYPRENTAATMWAHMSDSPPSVLERAPDVPVEFDAGRASGDGQGAERALHLRCRDGTRGGRRRSRGRALARRSGDTRDRGSPGPRRPGDPGRRPAHDSGGRRGGHRGPGPAHPGQRRRLGRPRAPCFQEPDPAVTQATPRAPAAPPTDRHTASKSAPAAGARRPRPGPGGGGRRPAHGRW